MFNLLSGIVYAICVAWPVIAIFLLWEFLVLLSEKFPKIGEFIVGDCTLDDDDELFGENDFYD